MRDFVRGALFSIILDFVPGASFLDLYAGTGAVGMEALSRGARTCTFVDASSEACAIVRRNADKLDVLDQCEVIEKNVTSAIDMFARRARRYDIVALDPPYHQDLIVPTLEALADGRILSDDPLVIVATHFKQGGAERFGLLQRVDARRYGDNRLDIYRRLEEQLGADADDT